ncbi:MAG: hypothetical protein ACXWZM_09960 [Solirubrobacterales bacterium]
MSCTRRGHQGPCRRSFTVAAGLAVALVVGGSASARAPEPAAAGSGAALEAKPVHRDPAAVREYWTARRMREARPAGLRLDPSRRTGSAATVAPTTAAGPARIPPARAAVDASSNNTGFPERVHGKVFLTINGGSLPGDYVCSGTVVTSNAHTLAWTAGHCVNDPEFGGGFATNWTFVAGYRNGQRPFGTWPATALFTTRGWREDIDIRLDLGAATLARDDRGRGIEDLLGARGIAFNQPRDQRFDIFGYPAMTNPLSTPPRFDFDGQRLWRCASPLTGSDDPPGPGPETIQVGCDMTGGASGGSWVSEGGFVNGITSYGYSSDGNHLYGPYLGSVAEDLSAEASGHPILCAEREVTNLGGSGADDFDGSSGADSFKLKAGGDRAQGLAADDAACGGAGGDRLDGGAGNDRLRGGAGRDLLVGGAGRDVCIGGAGTDRARGCEKRKRIP